MINKINPIYILALVFTIFFISIFSIRDKKEELIKANKNYGNFQSQVTNYKEYKKTWFDRAWVLNKVDSIIKSSTFKKEKILKVENKNILRVKIESKNQRLLNKFLNRILNEKFVIKNIDIKKDSIGFEIGLEV